MRLIAVLGCIVLAGCAAAPEKVSSVAQTESARMAVPTRKFSTFAAYELKPMTLSPAVTAEPDKVRWAGDLESRMRSRIEPLLAQWSAAPPADRSGTLVIEPRLASLKIVSGTARFWVGAGAGDSSIDIDLYITEKETGQVIATPRAAMTADAMTGGWSIGKSDENLLEYIAAVANQYLLDHY